VHKNNMQKSFLKTKYARQLISDYDTIVEDVKKFNTLWDQFWAKDSSVLGDLLTCHLILEFHLTNWLAAANPGVPSLDNARLSFSQKIIFSDNVDKTIQIMVPGFRCINKVRNAFSHNLSVTLDSVNLAPLREIVWPWHKAAGKAQNEGIQLVKDFTLMASGLLYGQLKSIERYGKGDGIVAYHRWLDVAMQSDEN